MSNFTNIRFLTFACKNAPMKYIWWTLAMCLASYAKKYFKAILEASGNQLSPTNFLFCRSPQTKILNFTLSRLPSDWISDFYTSMHGVIGSSFFGSSPIKVWLLIRFLISFWVAFTQVFSLPSDSFNFSKVYRFWNEMGNLWTRCSQKWLILRNFFCNSLKHLV